MNWTLPTRQDHPRIWLNTGSTPVSITAVQSKIVSTHSGYWDNLITWCNSQLNEGLYPDAWYRDKECENIGALAFSYLIDHANIKHGNRALRIAEFIRTQKIPAGTQKRHYLLAMAMVYDWCYDLLGDLSRRELRTRIADYVRVMKEARDRDRFWSVSHGNILFAVSGLTAILEDGTDDENDLWESWMDEATNQLDDGTNDCYHAIYRHFGSTDGGTHHGSGPELRMLDAYVRAFPSMYTGLGYYWRTGGDAWYENLAQWQIWHVRSSEATRTSMFRQGDQVCDHLFSRATQAHALQIGTSNTATLGRTCMWLEDVVNDAGDEKIEGPYEIWNILWRTTTRAALVPTVSNQGGYTLKVFDTAGKAVLRDGWGADAVCLTLSAPTYFLGGHQHRDAGHFELSAFGEKIFVGHGHYCPETTVEPKIVGDAIETGHRWSYAQRAISKNCLLIRDSSEVSYRTLTRDSMFGVEAAGVITQSDVGDQLWPKDAHYYQPQDFDAMDDVSAWHQQSLVAHIEETDFSYVVMGLSSKYLSDKVTKYRRHVLWVEAGAISGWNYPAIVIWDDFEGSIDPVHGPKTCVYCLQTNVQGTGTANNLLFTTGGAACRHIVVSPTVTVEHVQGFKDLDGVRYSPPSIDTQSDSLLEDAEAVWRAQITPSTAATTISFVSVLFPTPSGTDLENPPTVTLIDDGTWTGVTIGGIEAKMRKGNIFQASVDGTDGSTKTTSTSSSTTTSLTTSLSTTTVSAQTSPPETSDVSPPRMPQRNPTLDKVSTRLNLAGAGQTSPILAGLAGTFHVTLQDGEELQRWRIYSDLGFEKELQWVLTQDGEDALAERTDAITSVIFGVDTDKGPFGVRNYIEWITNFGTSRKHFWVRESPVGGGLYIANSDAMTNEVVFSVSENQSVSFGINVLPGWDDEFGHLHTYGQNKWTNTLRTWGGAFTAEVFLDDAVIISERDVADIHGYYWPEPEIGSYTIKVRLRAAQGSIYYVDLVGLLRVESSGS